MSLATLGAPASAVIGAIVGSVVAVAGALMTTLLTAKTQRIERAADRNHELLLQNASWQHERQQRLREEMIQAATQFAAALGWIASRMQFLHLADVGDVLSESATRLSTAQSLLSPLALLFGPSSDTADRAKTAYFRVTQLMVPLRELSELASVDERLKSPANRTIMGRGNEQGVLAEAQAGLAAFTAAAESGLRASAD